ncbi:MAG TPA: adenylate/guanylate cyclase domain-containing protein [Gemmatimonadaceae bacterium]|nr:adenylate/guanylate cyclase domain-containing protein [Gemmatimonadaceae bacterium]
MSFRLIGAAGGMEFALREGGVFVVGRAAGCDIVLLDPTVSRRHAELGCRKDEVAVRDLGSANGVFVNGERVEEAVVHEGDEVGFGAVAFRLATAGSEETARSEAAAGVAPTAGESGERARGSEQKSDRGGAGREGGAATAVTETPVSGSAIIERRSLMGNLGRLARYVRGEWLAPAGSAGRGAVTAPEEGEEDGADTTHADTAKKLALLLEVSKGLSRAIDVDALLESMSRMLFQILDVDRVAIELIDEQGERVPKIARERSGDTPTGRIIPRSIARPVVAEKVAILSGDAPHDERFGGSSIIAQRVRSAMCTPLIGGDDRVRGIIYVDNLSAPRRFDEDDLDFLVAFSNIAAAAIENGELAERIRRDLLVRSNFERFFTPSLAARIASTTEVVRPGGEKRTVAVLFGDIRGFTALAEAMRPDDLARLLSSYYQVMVEIVFRHGGTLDKFIGDAIMAQWGAPIATPTDADSALEAAREMVRGLADLNAHLRAEHGELPCAILEMGFGLNYGEAFAGYVGAERRLEYTVIGDTVNTANRLCAEANAGEILITGEMRAALLAPPLMTERGTMELRGKSQPTAVYCVLP